ncbi:MAG: MarR family winged helix-turn-helix transcriptional regulator [Chitinophagales bacterium]
MELEQCLNFVLTRAQQSVHQLFKAELAPLGVTPGQYGILRCLWDENGQTAKQMAERLCLDGSTVTGILDRLEQKGLIKKQTDPKDRRALRVVLTKEGKALEKPIDQAIISANIKALEKFNDEQSKSLKELLHELGVEK